MSEHGSRYRPPKQWKQGGDSLLYTVKQAWKYGGWSYNRAWNYGVTDERRLGIALRTATFGSLAVGVLGLAGRCANVI